MLAQYLFYKSGDNMQIKFLKTFVMWVFGAFGYGLIEIIFRGYTHISMGILGGLCLISMSLLNTLFV